jgi:hypothetical protein
MTRAGTVVAPPVGFRRLALGGWGLFFFAVSASAPLTVLIGGILDGFAVTGVVEVPAAFLLLTAVLVLIWVGHVGMARHVRHSGPLYAHLAQGLGPLAASGASPRGRDVVAALERRLGWPSPAGLDEAVEEVRAEAKAAYRFRPIDGGRTTMRR